MYHIFNDKSISIKSQEKWNIIFENIDLDWKTIYNLPAKSCNNTKIHWFQYRIIHRILATNDLLLKLNIRNNNLCTFCGILPEKIQHLFWHCHVVLEFWETIEQLFLQKIHYALNVNKQTAIFGITHNICYNRSINYILILTRYYIYKCRLNNKSLNIQAWKNEIKHFILIEKLIAIKNDTFEKFTKEWEKWSPIFEEVESNDPV